jgi:hypothetical protein
MDGVKSRSLGKDPSQWQEESLSLMKYQSLAPEPIFSLKILIPFIINNTPFLYSEFIHREVPELIEGHLAEVQMIHELPTLVRGQIPRTLCPVCILKYGIEIDCRPGRLSPFRHLHAPPVSSSLQTMILFTWPHSFYIVIGIPSSAIITFGENSTKPSG